MLENPGFPQASPSDKDTSGRNLLTPDCRIYQEIVRVTEVVRLTEPLRFGRMYFPQIPVGGVQFDFPLGNTTPSRFPGSCTRASCSWLIMRPIRHEEIMSSWTPPFGPTSHHLAVPQGGKEYGPNRALDLAGVHGRG